MIAARSFPFGGIPVYNPQALSKTEALAQFHARQAAYSRLMDLLREERPSHVLIIGTRGMGKTTLLQRVRYGVEDDIELNGRYLALAFPEEQYNVNRLHHFLLNTVDALADALERLGDERMLARVEAYAESAGKLGREEIEDQVPKFLAEVSEETHRSFLLLVDNADRLFETIEDREQWALRDLLLGRRDLTLFGATTQASEGIYEPQRAFFEFFKVESLSPLTFQEVRDLLLQLSESVEETEAEKGTAKRRVEEWLAADAGRLRTLVQLTGGNPRTTVLLFHLVLDGLGGGAREYLEQLLDQCTPNYKGRVDELPAQSQQVLDAVSLRWDPATAMEIAADTGLETTAVSTHLTRLVRQGILEKADPGDSKKALYQVAERFFNIWYLMRASRRVRAKLRWFVEFLRVFFDAGELEEMAWERVGKFRSAEGSRCVEIETAFAYVLASGTDHKRFEDVLRREYSDMEPEWRPYLDLLPQIGDRIDGLSAPGTGETASEKGKGDLDSLRRTLESLVEKARSISDLSKTASDQRQFVSEVESVFRSGTEDYPELAPFWGGLGAMLSANPECKGEAEAVLRRGIELDPQSALSWCALGDVLAGNPERKDEAEAAYRRAITLDPKWSLSWGGLGNILAAEFERRDEAEAAYRQAIELDPASASFWNNLGNILASTPDRLPEAEAAFRKAIELNPTEGGPWGNLGNVLASTRERGGEAELSYRKALELDPNVAAFWGNLGIVLAAMPERSHDAEAAYRKAIELNPRSASFWKSLGILLDSQPERRDEEEVAYRTAIEIDPDSAVAWNNLGVVLDSQPAKRGEADAAFRRAVKLDPKLAIAWNNFGTLLRRAPGNEAEAEDALRKAIQLDPGSAKYWFSLGDLLSATLERLDEAESAFRRGLELEPTNGRFWAVFGVFLACRAGKPKEAELALRRSEDLEPDCSRNLRNLGVLLYCEMLDKTEGLLYLRRAQQLEPSDPVSAAVLAACAGASEADAIIPIFMDGSRQATFWSILLELCVNYPPFGKILSGICDIIQKRDSSNGFAGLYHAIALAQLRDFPRASVALEDALEGDPIELLTWGREALETFFAAAVRNGRVRECLDVLDKKEWRDAWRPIYEALKAVEAGSGDYLKRVAAEIREPAAMILRRIAPELRGLPARSSEAT